MLGYVVLLVDTPLGLMQGKWSKGSIDSLYLVYLAPQLLLCLEVGMYAPLGMGDL